MNRYSSYTLNEQKTKKVSRKYRVFWNSLIYQEFSTDSFPWFLPKIDERCFKSKLGIFSVADWNHFLTIDLFFAWFFENLHLGMIFGSLIMQNRDYVF